MKDFFRRHIDVFSTLTLILTVVFFAIALFEKGFTHDLLLEAGVFLISVKLVLASYKTNKTNQNIQRKVDEILEILKH